MDIGGGSIAEFGEGDLAVTLDGNIPDLVLDTVRPLRLGFL